MIPRGRAAALVPVYNESGQLAPFLDRLLLQGIPVLVVDDGSTDGSAGIARSKGVEVLALGRNRGKGHALRAGLEELARRGFDWIVILDGDGQHRPEEIPLFLEKAAEGRAGVLTGTRLSNPAGMPPLRYWTNRLMSWIIGRLARQSIQDTQCGFKMVSADFVRKARLRSDHYEIESEILLEAGRLGLTIVSVPVSSVYGTEESHIRPAQDTLRFIRFLVGRFLK